ncbi:hypothetical protein [Nannocystis pusilla]|uniref:hypothetical protein n=1 Tax=Nannocystis pusilla TaxID=889268 RepID=UPI003B778190
MAALAYLAAHATERMQRPREDLLTKLVQAEVDGERLTTNELVNFDDLAFDVVLKDGVAWIAGASFGKHNGVWQESRGILVPLDLETRPSA